MKKLTELTIVEAKKKLAEREISAVELAQAYLDAIAKKDTEIRAYREVYDDVLDQARAVDARLARGDGGALLGIPMAIKDNILVKGKTASAGSKIIEHYESPYDATVVAALRDAGAVFLGRTNQDEFGMGSSTENSAFGPTHNPLDLSRVPGGSSGGSAAAVAGNLALAALGTDSGGSCRAPAAFCGIVGMKSTYGAVSRYGMIPMAASFNQVGLLTRTVADAKLLYAVLDAEDTRYDAQNVPTDRRIPKNFPGAGKRLGVPRSFLEKGIDSHVLASFEATLAKLKRDGYEIVDIELPNIHFALPVYYILVPAEISTDLARFDGMRFGLSVNGENLLAVYEKSRAQGFGDEPRRRILLGTYILSAGYYDAYYNKACIVRELIKSDFVRAFRDVDVIVTPTMPTPPFKLGEKADDPLAMYLTDIFTITANVVGIPAISVPSDSAMFDGTMLPVGFQIMGPWFAEELLFAIGRAVTGER